MSKDLTTINENGFELANAENINEVFVSEMDGLTPTFERVKIPAGGGLAYEIPGENANSPDLVKEFRAVILYHHPLNTYYKEKFTGGNNPPDCGSLDGHSGIEAESGEIRDCKSCGFNKFGSGESGGKACKQKRRIYVLKEGEMLPMLMSLPTGSLGEFSRYIMRLLSKGKKPSCVVTKFSLKKAQNSGGISYSQGVFSLDRELTEDEKKAVQCMSEQIKTIAVKINVVETETE